MTINKFTVSDEEYFDMIIIFEECMQNVRVVRAFYVTKFPHQCYAGKTTVIRASKTVNVRIEVEQQRMKHT